jgi:dihydroflavonol-4-reductase
MRVLVTGANGFLAANIVRELLSRGYEVRGMVRPGADLRSLNGLAIEYFKGNITHQPDIDKAVAGCDVVIHAAADTSQRYSSSVPLRKVNVEVVKHFIGASQRNNVERFIFVSTGNTIAFGTKNNPGKEENGIGEYFIKSGYALSKLEAEQLVMQAVNKSGLNAIIVNPTFMIGPYDSKPSSGRIFQMMYPHKLVFIPKGGKNFTPVADAAVAICNAINLGEAGERFLLAGENLSYKEFLVIVKDGAPHFSVLIPNWVLLIAGHVGSFLRFLGVNAELSVSNAKILISDDYYTGKKAVDVLKMPQTPITVAVAEAINWFKKYKML